MDKQSFEIREIGQVLTIAIAAMLFGSTLVLAAVGPAHASENAVLASAAAKAAPTPGTARYLA